MDLINTLPLSVIAYSTNYPEGNRGEKDQWLFPGLGIVKPVATEELGNERMRNTLEYGAKMADHSCVDTKMREK